MPGRNKLFLDGNAGLNSTVCMTVNLNDKKFRQSYAKLEEKLFNICLSLCSQNTQAIDFWGFFCLFFPNFSPDNPMQPRKSLNGKFSIFTANLQTSATSTRPQAFLRKNSSSKDQDLGSSLYFVKTSLTLILNVTFAL